MLDRSLRTLALAALPFAATGCGCNDQAFNPIDWSDLSDDYGKWLSMDVAPDGSPVIAYYNQTYGALGFAIGKIQPDDSVQWMHEQVDGYPDSSGLDPGDCGQFASMKVAPDGTVWIGYAGSGSLKVAHRQNGIWTNEVADYGSDAGQWASLAIDSKGSPVIAHHDAGDGILRVARLNDGQWDGETVATGKPFDEAGDTGGSVHRDADVGMFARLVISGDTEYIAYYDAAQQDLNLLEGYPGSYAESTVVHEDGVDVGQWASMQVDGSTVRIAYQDVTNQDLRLATREGSGKFKTEAVDTADYVGSDSEVFIGLDGSLRILYFDGRYNNMKMAVQSGKGWDLQTLGGESSAVGFFNEVAKTNGKAYAASYDYTNRKLFWRVVP